MKLVSCIPKLHIWANQLLFLAVSPIPYREHDIVSDKLMVSIQGSITVTLDSGKKITTHSFLVKAGTTFDKHYIDATKATMAIYYLAPVTQDYSALESVMLKARDGLHYNHPQEELLTQQLLRIRNESLPPEQAYILLRDFIVQPKLQNIIFKEFDPRIIAVIQRIRETVSENLSVNAFAESVYLSESRLEKLFKEQIGVPIRKYRLRYRVFIGTIQLALGRSVTDAALAAGFASSAHFSKSFSAINGIPPSTTFLKPPFLEVLIADEVLEAIYSKTRRNESKKNTTVHSFSK
ncbi:MAG: AraC-like DNA-binding protein [Pseudohongiellaceae bacterium]|jgi:AraC-like DNA-binding protein